MTEHSDEQKVGYKSPPKQTQWKKGQSGNPSGKKKKEISILDQIEALAGEEVTVQQNGIPMAMPRRRLILLALFGKAAKGDLSCAKFLFEHCGFVTNDFPTQGDIRSVEIDENALAVLQTHADWVEVVEQAKKRLGEALDMDGEEGSDDEPDAG